MELNRLLEIIRLSKTCLPTVGPIGNAPDLLKKVNRALEEMQPYQRLGLYPVLIMRLLDLRREAQETVDWGNTQFVPGETERGDHNLR